MSLDAPSSNSSQRDPVVFRETTTTDTTPVFMATPRVVDEEELRRREEAERHDQEGLNATIDSIFTLPDDDDVRPHSRKL